MRPFLRSYGACRYSVWSPKESYVGTGFETCILVKLLLRNEALPYSPISTGAAHILGTPISVILDQLPPFSLHKPFSALGGVK